MVGEDFNIEEFKRHGRRNNRKKRNRKNKYIFLYEWVFPLLIVAIIALSINRLFLIKVEIPSESMVPTLNINDQLFATKIYNTNNISRGDIIVFYSEELEELLIKRCIGIPGDKIEIADGIVTVNDEVLQEDYVKNPSHTYGTYEVPENKFFFLGDNRAVSKDSSRWVNPYIDGKDIKAKAKLKVNPLSDFGWIK